jgi:hypothetical protein
VSANKERIAGYIESLTAQVLYEKQDTFDVHHGPCGFNRVGFRIGDRVFWTGIESWPGVNQTHEYELAEAMAREVVTRWEAGRP